MRRIVLAMVVLAALAGWSQQSRAAGNSCSAVILHGLPPGSPEGSQTEAGLYNAHFGRVTVEGRMKNGQPGDYTISVKDKQLDAAASLPAGIDPCLTEKGVPVPTDATPQPCQGEKLKLVIVPQGAKRVLVLYAGIGHTWNYCRTSLWGG